jgi:hypothetical protein
VAKALVERICVQHGVPHTIHSDQGPEFESRLFGELSRLLEFRKTRTTPYHPQSDGLVERANRTILAMLSAFVNERGDDWDEHLPLVLGAYRSSVHASTGCTPFAMLYGREMSLPVDLMFPVKDHRSTGSVCGPEYVEWLRQSMASAHEFARRHLAMAAVRQKRAYDKRSKHQPKGLQVGDLVRYKRPALQVANKFNLPWVGPYKVIRLVGEIDVEIAFWRGGKAVGRRSVVHLNDVKLYGRINTSSEEELIIDVENDLLPGHSPNTQIPEPSQTTSTGLEDDLEVPLRRSNRLKHKEVNDR